MLCLFFSYRAHGLTRPPFAFRGCEPLTPDDIAEVVVFTATRRENLVIADTLVFPNHQVSPIKERSQVVISGEVADKCFSRSSQASALIMHRKNT